MEKRKAKRNNHHDHYKSSSVDVDVVVSSSISLHIGMHDMAAGKQLKSIFFVRQQLKIPNPFFAPRFLMCFLSKFFFVCFYMHNIYLFLFLFTHQSIFHVHRQTKKGKEKIRVQLLRLHMGIKLHAMMSCNMICVCVCLCLFVYPATLFKEMSIDSTGSKLFVFAISHFPCETENLFLFLSLQMHLTFHFILLELEESICRVGSQLVYTFCTFASTHILTTHLAISLTTQVILFGGDKWLPLLLFLRFRDTRDERRKMCKENGPCQEW